MGTSQSSSHHERAKKHLSEHEPPQQVVDRGVEEERVWRVSKILRSIAYSILSISQQALYVAQNTRDIADELADIKDILEKK